MSVAPSPKSHAHMVGFPLERSVKLTESGASPDRGTPSKSALIAGQLSTVINACFVTVPVAPNWFEAVRVTV